MNMLRTSSVVVATSFVLGAVGGGVAGWVVANRDQAVPPIVSSTSTAPVTQVIQVEREIARPKYPGVFSARTISPVASLVKRVNGKTLDDRLVHREQVVGQVIALTADGWFGTSLSAMSGLRAADAGVIWNGQVYPVLSATRDQATDLVFLKTEAQGLPVVRFVSARDTTTGMNVWMEAFPKRFSAEMIRDAYILPVQTVSSERATRRFLVSGEPVSHGSGGAIWSETGGLVGVMEWSTADGWRVIPASHFSSALSAVLSKQKITHASLGIQTIDLSVLAVENSDRNNLPSLGAWVKTVSSASSTIREGDVIERLERDILDGGTDLGERLLEYLPGTTVTIHGLRKGVAWQRSVTLGSVITSEKLK
ncbi:serine protease [Candidatus Uhrbacteria bacterium]|nr:serine protease [Candidatus Uhrbacteria bacterium]